MILGDINDLETLNNEYKEFCLKTSYDAIYSKKNILNILNSGKLSNNYNSLIYQSIEFYFNNYIPKYISSFLNSNNSGNIFIGINDKGENTGIPILNYMNSTIINNLFYSALYKHILNFYKFSKYVTIDIIPLTINTKLINNNEFNYLVTNYNKLNNSKINKLQEYYTLKQQWKNNMAKYEKKIDILLNLNYFRKQLFHFILQYSTLQNKNHLFSALFSNDIIYFNSHDKFNINTISYWACKFKDYILNKILKNRPIKPNISIRIHPDLIFNRITPLRLLFIQNNYNIKYFIIKISVNKYQGKHIAYFKYPYSEQYNFKIRRLNNNNQPYCSNF
tara:strand:+ start:348 stop:1349 length:1002 start_codon:yes stop_codon:yes gene_type:complete